MSDMQTIRLDEQKLRNFAYRAFCKAGAPAKDAEVAASMLVDTEKRGVITHGLARLGPWYVRPLMQGVYTKTPNIRVLSDTLSCAHLDADGGLGFMVGKRAMDMAMEKAQATGAGFVNVENVGHFGAGFNYPLQASRKGMIGFCCTNTPPWMAAPGTATAAIGTNPLAFAAPAGKHPDFLLDMSCTVVAAAKALHDDSQIPEGWAIDGEGKPITEQTGIGFGKSALLPLGGDPAHGSFKGFGLGMMVEILTAMLSANACGKLHLANGGTKWCSFFGALRIDAFVDKQAFLDRMDEMIDDFENLPGKLLGTDKLYVPGGHGASIVKDREINGIPLSIAVIEDHRALARELDIDIDY